MKKCLVFLMSFLLISCGDLGVQDENGVDQEQLRRRENLEKLAAQLKGFYQGELNHVDGETYDIELRFYSTLEPIGRDDNGNVVTLPKLYGRVRFSDFVYPSDGWSYEVTLTEDGRIEMFYIPPTPGGGGEASTSEGQVFGSILGRWNPGVITEATWTDKEGPKGSLEAKRVSVDVPIEDSEALRERSFRQFEPLQGKFLGSLHELDGKFFDDFSIDFYIDDSSETLRLSAFIRGEDRSGFLLDRLGKMRVTWDPRTKLFKINHQVGLASLSMSGYLTSDELKVDVMIITAKAFVAKIKEKKEAEKPKED